LSFFRKRIQPSLLSIELLCVIVGLALRIIWYATAKNESFFYAHVHDSALYHELAQRILSEGLPFSEPFFVAPMYGVFLAGVYKVFGLDPAAVYIVQIGLSAVTIALTAHLGRRLFGGWGAIVGGLAAAIYPAAILYDVRLLSVGLGTLFTVGTAVCAHRAWLSGRLSSWVIAGMVLGLGALVRGNLLLVAPLMALIALWRARGLGRLAAVAAVVVGVSVGIGPATWHNHAAGAGFVPVSLGGGINLYRGNNPYFVDTAVHPFRLPARRDGLLQKSQLIASMDNDRQLTAGEADRYWLGKTIMAWYDAPGRAVGITLRKITQVLGVNEIGDHMDLEQMASRSSVLGAIPPIVGPLSVLALLGLIVTRRERDVGPACVLAGGILSVALFFVVSRYRAPLVPLLGVYAGAGLQWLWLQTHQRSLRPLMAALVGMGATGAALVLPTTHTVLPWNGLIGDEQAPGLCAIDRHIRHAPEVEERFNVGIFALNHGQLPDAEEAMWSVLRTDATHTAAGVNLSWLLIQKGAFKEAVAIAEKVIALDACDDKAWSNLATAHLRLGQYDAAHLAAKRAATIDPYNPGYGSMVGETLMAKGDRVKAKPLFERALRWDPDLWQAQARLGRIALEEGRYDDASKYLQAAVRAQPGRQELVGLLGLSEVGRGNEEGARNLLQAAVKSGMRGPALGALARALSKPGGP
jgi:tetratricopeptide (TPR) repeat protein